MQRSVLETTKIHELTGWTTTRTLEPIGADVIAFGRASAKPADPEPPSGEGEGASSVSPS